MVTKATYFGDGSTDEYDVTFPYDAADKIHAYINGVETTFTWVTESRIQLDEVPASGAEVLLRRLTSIDERVVDFSDEAVLTENDLDSAVGQLLGKSQELESDTEDLITRSFRVRSGDTAPRMVALSNYYGKLLSVSTDGETIDPINVSAAALENLSDIADDIVAVSDAASQVSVIYSDLTGPNTIGIVSGIADKIVIAAADSDAINAIVTDFITLDTVGIVAADLSGDDTIGAVAGIAGHVVTVSEASDALDGVYTNLTGTNTIGIVAADLSGDDTIGAVAAIADHVVTVSEADTAIATIYTDLITADTIGIVAADKDGDDTIGTVAINIQHVIDTSDALPAINEVVDNLDNIQTIADASDGLAIMTRVERRPGAAEVSYAYADKNRWYVLTPNSVQHKILGKTTYMPDWKRIPGATKHVWRNADGDVWASMAPGLGGFKHADIDDARRRLNALELASQRDPQWDDLYPSADIVFLPITGQSRSIGHHAVPWSGATVAFSSSFPPERGLMFNGGVRPDDTSTNTSTTMASLVPLVESYVANPVGGSGTGYKAETFASGMIDMISQLLAEESVDHESVQKFLTYTAGRGATSILDLVPSNDTYGRDALLRAGVTKAFDTAVNGDKSVDVGALLLSQGEADIGYDIAFWATKFAELRDGLKDHIETTTGVERPLPAIIEQIATHPIRSEPSPALAILQAQMAFSDPYVTTFPGYPINRPPGDAHEDGINSYWKGGFYGWLLKRWLYDGVKIMPLIAQWRRNGNQIIGTFNVGPNRRMRLDTDFVPEQPNWGVTLEDETGAEQTLSGGRFSARGDAVIFDCAVTPEAGWTVFVGKQTTDDLMGTSNLCDDTPLILNTIARPIRRYAAIWGQELA